MNKSIQVVFKLQAKNFFKDFKTQYLDEEGLYQYKPKFFKDIDDIILSFDIDEEDITLIKAQHYISLLAGFNNWHDLIRLDEDGLDLVNFYLSIEMIIQIEIIYGCIGKIIC